MDKSELSGGISERRNILSVGVKSSWNQREIDRQQEVGLEEIIIGDEAEETILRAFHIIFVENQSSN